MVGVRVDDQLAQPAAGVVADQGDVRQTELVDEVADHRRDRSR